MKPEAGWYPDPESNNLNRYWNGNEWTEMVVPSATVRPESKVPEFDKTITPDFSIPTQTSYPKPALSNPSPIFSIEEIIYPTRRSLRESSIPQNVGSLKLPTRKQANRTTVALSIIVSALLVLTLTLIAVASVFLITSASKESTPTPEPTSTSSPTYNAPIVFQDGYIIPNGSTLTWTAPSYWVKKDSTAGSVTYTTRSCDVKAFYEVLKNDTKGSGSNKDELLSAMMLQETTHTPAAQIIAEAYSINVRVQGQKDLILLASPWTMKVNSTVNNVPNTETVVYGFDAVQASIANKNTVGLQVGCENQQDIEAVLNELYSQGGITVS